MGVLDGGGMLNGGGKTRKRTYRGLRVGYFCHGPHFPSRCEGGVGKAGRWSPNETIKIKKTKPVKTTDTESDNIVKSIVVVTKSKKNNKTDKTDNIENTNVSLDITKLLEKEKDNFRKILEETSVLEATLEDKYLKLEVIKKTLKELLEKLQTTEKIKKSIIEIPNDSDENISD